MHFLVILLIQAFFLFLFALAVLVLAWSFFPSKWVQNLWLSPYRWTPKLLRWRKACLVVIGILGVVIIVLAISFADVLSIDFFTRNLGIDRVCAGVTG